MLIVQIISLVKIRSVKIPVLVLVDMAHNVWFQIITQIVSVLLELLVIPSKIVVL